jgi:hypothetical protein
MKRTKQSAEKAKVDIADYVTCWHRLIAETANPHTLLGRWRKERDHRDDLEVPIVERLELLRLIAPEEVNDGPPTR